MTFLWAFLIGGAICTIGQILILRTKLTTARILVIFVLAGLFLEAVTLFKPLKTFAGAGASVPILGFGASLAKGVIKAVKKDGFLGIFTGGLTATAAGIAAAITFAFVFALISKSRSKQ